MPNFWSEQKPNWRHWRSHQIAKRHKARTTEPSNEHQIAELNNRNFERAHKYDDARGDKLAARACPEVSERCIGLETDATLPAPPHIRNRKSKPRARDPTAADNTHSKSTKRARHAIHKPASRHCTRAAPHATRPFCEGRGPKTPVSQTRSSLLSCAPQP